MIGIAKFDAGVCLTGKFKPLNPELTKKRGVSIIKGEKYEIPEGYDFKNKSSIFEPVKGAK